MASEASTSIPGCCSRSRASSAGRISWRAAGVVPSRSVPSTPAPARVAAANAASTAAKRGAAVGEQPPAGLRELDVPRRAREQLDSELALELADRGAQRRRGHVQPVGRAGEVELLGDGHEVPQMAQFGHRRPDHDAARRNPHGSRLSPSQSRPYRPAHVLPPHPPGPHQRQPRAQPPRRAGLLRPAAGRHPARPRRRRAARRALAVRRTRRRRPVRAHRPASSGRSGRGRPDPQPRRGRVAARPRRAARRPARRLHAR